MAYKWRKAYKSFFKDEFSISNFCFSLRIASIRQLSVVCVYLETIGSTFDRCVSSFSCCCVRMLLSSTISTESIDLAWERAGYSLIVINSDPFRFSRRCLSYLFLSRRYLISSFIFWFSFSRTAFFCSEIAHFFYASAFSFASLLVTSFLAISWLFELEADNMLVSV